MKISIKLTTGIFILFTFYLLLFTSKVNAETYCDTPTDLGNCYVDGENGLDTNDGKTPETAWATITHAATLVDDGDTVNVKGGITYIENNIIPTNGGSPANYITFQAWPGYGIPAIDATGGSGFNLFYFAPFFVPDYIIISGFEIENANTGCVNISDETSSIIIKNNIVHDCATVGIFVKYDASSTTSSIKIYNNVSYNNDFGIYFDASHTPSGSILVHSINNIATHNITGLMSDTAIPISIDYNNVWDNDTDYSGCSAGPNDISSNPLFIDPINNNFHLQPSSPSINTGTTLLDVPLDILGVPRPQETGYDMGAYEYYDISVTLNPLTPDPTSDNTPTFTGTSTSAHVSTITSISYSIDGGPWVTEGVSGTTNFTITLPELPDGSHTIVVRATDSYGNVSDASLYGSDTFDVNTGETSVEDLTETGENITLVFQIILLLVTLITVLKIFKSVKAVR